MILIVTFAKRDLLDKSVHEIKRCVFSAYVSFQHTDRQRHVADLPGLLASFGPALPRGGVKVSETAEVVLSASSC